MNIELLDTNFDTVYFIDSYESFIWTERYSECGEFELYTPITNDLVNNVQNGYYISIDESDRLMIVETVEIETDIENGSHLKITGRSLESILDRRVIWPSITLDGSLQTQIKNLITRNAISPSDSLRKIPGLYFKTITDNYIDSLDLQIQCLGENLYEVIVEICRAYNLGFKLIKTDDGLEFSLYSGSDRSDDIEFSPVFDNLLNSDYIESTNSYKNTIYVIGDEEGGSLNWEQVGDKSGLDRREMYLEANDVQRESTDESGNTVTVDGDLYDNLLIQKGKEELANNSHIASFDGNVDYNKGYALNTDYFLGDIVGMMNEYGFGGRVRITEIVRSMDNDGYEIYPTFELVEE